jgi:putative colanic acid biosynthesis acetyltransferase WcaF
MPFQVKLSTFDNSWYSPGRGRVIAALWFFIGLPLIRSSINPSSSFRRFLLRLFGAQIGSGVIIKPGVRVKYPWRLKIGAHSWIGEDCWIDNLDQVTIGSNACLSQGVYLCTGNHDWSDPAFGLMIKPITVGDGAWVGAMSVIGPGVMVGACAVALVGSVVTSTVPPFEMHSGVPARLARIRNLQNRETHTSEELSWH